MMRSSYVTCDSFSCLFYAVSSYTHAKLGSYVVMNDSRTLRSGAKSRKLHSAHILCWFILILINFTAVQFRSRVKRVRYQPHEYHEAHTRLQDFCKIVQECGAIEYRNGFDAARDFESRESTLLGLLTITDMTFVLAYQECKTTFQHIRWACVRGKQVDSCLTKQFQGLIPAHAYATSVSHAFILMHAHLKGYKHISIVEDDVLFTETVETDIVSDLRKNIFGSRKWNFVRLGYRPFFLESQFKASSTDHGAEPYSCPTACRCNKIGSTLCHIAEKGCDMRSSHFYMINIDIVQDLLFNLLNISNVYRVIDWFVLQNYGNQLYMLDPAAVQKDLDLPIELQSGFSNLFKQLCVI